MKRNKPTKYKPTVRPGVVFAEQEAHEVDANYNPDRLLQSQTAGFCLHEYLQMKRHRKGCPPFLKGKWLDVLMRYVPGPLGLGMGIQQIAADMRMHRSSIHRILVRLKNKFPEALGRIESMRKIMVRQGGSMTKHHGTKSYDLLFVETNLKNEKAGRCAGDVRESGGGTMLSHERIKDII